MRIKNAASNLWNRIMNVNISKLLQKEEENKLLSQSTIST